MSIVYYMSGYKKIISNELTSTSTRSRLWSPLTSIEYCVNIYSIPMYYIKHHRFHITSSSTRSRLWSPSAERKLQIRLLRWGAVLQKQLTWAFCFVVINPCVLSANRVDLGFSV